MNSLFTYVLALKEKVNGVSVLEQEFHQSTAVDGDIMIEKSELVVKFENGVTLKNQVERDQTNKYSEQACSECWISYEIIFQPAEMEITPKKKIFTNQCQESFWIKINKMQSST